MALGNKFSAAFRSGAIAKTVGIHWSDNPFINNNILEQEEAHWLEGYANGGLIDVILYPDEIIEVIEKLDDKKKKMFLFQSLISYRVKNHPVLARKFLTFALKNAEAQGDIEFLKGKLGEIS